ncbi:late control protein B [Pantoea sp. Acro-835]|uniref:Late control protein B n=1 Tax=Candidatus Pantoea multigeneris TaxID=2608357 RepID=A0ABX0RDA0_9GAMM|nr:late control protein B [Pantoea multigeneris]
MIRCPLGTHSSYTRTSRYITEQKKEAYYQRQNIVRSFTFKTVESVDKNLCQPIQTETVMIYRRQKKGH